MHKKYQFFVLLKLCALMISPINAMGASAQTSPNETLKIQVLPCIIEDDKTICIDKINQKSIDIITSFFRNTDKNGLHLRQIFYKDIEKSHQVDIGSYSVTDGNKPAATFNEIPLTLKNELPFLKQSFSDAWDFLSSMAHSGIAIVDFFIFKDETQSCLCSVQQALAEIDCPILGQSRNQKLLPYIKTLSAKEEEDLWAKIIVKKNEFVDAPSSTCMLFRQILCPILPDHDDDLLKIKAHLSPSCVIDLTNAFQKIQAIPPCIQHLSHEQWREACFESDFKKLRRDLNLQDIRNIDVMKEHQV